MLLQIGVSLIQAYVFTILSCTYIKDSIYLHLDSKQNTPLYFNNKNIFKHSNKIFIREYSSTSISNIS